MRIAVIDDEKYSRLELVHHIRNFAPQAEITEAASGAQALAVLARQSFDIVFLDIHLGDMDGTVIASRIVLAHPETKVVFVTAFSEYAVKAFEIRVDDYILKPFDPQRIRRVFENHARSAAVPAPHAEKRIAVGSNRRTTFLDIDDITYIETDGVGRGCILHTRDGQAYSDSTPMSAFENRLREQGFCRIHKAYLVQTKYVREIFPWNNNSSALHILGDTAVLPIGRDRVKALKKRLGV